MRTEDMRWLLAVADGATVAEVAARHHTTQPAVTRGLQRLGREAGAPVTERVGRRLQLTFAGEALAATGRRMLSELEGALQEIARADDPHAGTVAVGFLNPLGTWLVPGLLAGFRASHPAVRVHLRHDGATRILAALLAGELDLLLTEPPPLDAPPLRVQPLFEDELCVAVPADHRLARRRRVRVAELAGEPWVLQPVGYGTRRAVAQLCAAAGVDLVVGYEDHDLATLRALIGAGAGIGLFSDRPPPPPGVVYLSLVPRLRRTVGLLTRPQPGIPRAAAAFAAHVLDTAPALARASQSPGGGAAQRKSLPVRT